MRRIVFAALALLAAGGALWLRMQGARSSFGAYTGAQLDVLEAGYRAAMRSAGQPGTTARSRHDAAVEAMSRREAQMEAAISAGRVETERARRRALLGAVLVGVLAAIGAVLPRGGGGRVRSSPEERRLTKALGDPGVLLEGERQKAAKLLGVTPDAPPAVIEAALAAQLAARGPSSLEGLAPDLRRVVLEQRQALQRARDLLLGGATRAAAAPQRQQ